MEQYDCMTHWKSDFGSVTRFEELKTNHLYRILQVRADDPKWCGHVPVEKAPQVFAKLWEVARERCRAGQGTVEMGPFPCTGGTTLCTDQKWVWAFWSNDKVWVTSDPSPFHDGPIIGTVKSTSQADTTAILNVLPHMVEWVKANMPQPRSQPLAWYERVLKAYQTIRETDDFSERCKAREMIHHEFLQHGEELVKSCLGRVVIGNRTTHEDVHNIVMVPGEGGKMYVKGDLNVEGKLHAPFSNFATNDMFYELQGQLRELQKNMDRIKAAFTQAAGDGDDL